MSPKCRPAMPVLAAASCVLVSGCMPLQYRLGSPADPYSYIAPVAVAESLAVPAVYRPAKDAIAPARPAKATQDAHSDRKTRTVSVAPADQISAQAAAIARANSVAVTPPVALPASPPVQAQPSPVEPAAQKPAPQQLAAAPIAPVEAPIQPIIKNAELPPVARQLIEEGRALFQQGEVMKARQKLNSAVSAPLGVILLEVGRTHDPNYVNKLQKADATADAAQARRLYEQAIKLGTVEARQELERLPKAETKTQ